MARLLATVTQVTYAADGFNFMPPSIRVIPTLQQRGLVRRDYEGETLRANYHLSKLLHAGITVCRVEGTHRLPVLRREDLGDRFPGLLDLIRTGALSAT